MWNNWKSALKYYLKSARQFEKSKDSARLSVLYRNIANIYKESGQNGQAIYFAKASIRYLTENSSVCDSASSYHAPIEPLGRFAQNEEARIFAVKALELAQRCPSGLIKPAIFHTVALHYKEMGKFTFGLQLVDSAIFYFENMEESTHYGFACLLKSQILVELYREKEAGIWVDKALKLLKGSRNWKDLMAGYQTQAFVAMGLKDYKKAAEAMDNYIVVKDSSHNEEVTAQLIEMEIRFETQKKQSQIANLENERQIQLLKIDRRNTWLLGSIGVLILVIFISFLIFRNNRQKIENLQKERKLIATNSILKGQDEERSRLARDLHDGLGGMLSGLKFSLNNMKGNVILDEENASVFSKSLGQLDSVITEMRRVAHSMMPEALVRFGLKEATQDLCDQVAKNSGLSIHFQTIGMNEELDKSVSLALYRIEQELLNNIIKHAEATDIQVQLVKDENQISLTVEDNGKGFDIENVKHGLGLSSIRNRVEALGGNLDIQSGTQNGTSILIEITV